MNDEHQFGFKPTIDDSSQEDESELTLQHRIYVCLTPLAVIVVLGLVVTGAFFLGRLF